MPEMPDPVSRCPIFGRLEEASGHIDKVVDGLAALEKEEDLVKVARDLHILGKTTWDCHGDTLTEYQYILQFWFGHRDEDGREIPGERWWTKYQPIDREVRRGFLHALRISRKYSRFHPNVPCPIKAVWICVEDEFDVNAELIQIPGEDAYVVLEIRTPPPECDVTEVRRSR